MANETNGVIYLEVDEDITSAIDKLTKSAGKNVQIVTAKRSTLFQSVINLRLLQKSAKDNGKELVLVTGDRVATSLAGRVGVAVASQVGEAAKVPSTTPLSNVGLADDEIDGGAIGETPKLPDTPLASKPEPKPSPLAASEPTTPEPSAAKPASKSKGSKVPNIGKMQKRVLWAALAIVLVVVALGLNYFLASAHVTLYAQGSQVNSSFTFTADPTVTSSTTATSVLTAQQLSETKTLNATVTASGTKDDGSPATGTITVSNCVDNQTHDLPAGTQFQAPNGLIFTSTADVTVPGGSGNFLGCNSPGKATANVQSAANGDQYNLGGGTKYTITSLPASEQSSFNGTGNQMQGGVTKVDKVITASDVAAAEQAALSSNKASAASDLSGKANNRQVAISQSFQQNVTGSTPNPAVGSVASSGSLAVQVTYTELAVAKSDLSKLAQAQEGQQLGPQKQIYDDGSGDLQLTSVGSPASNGAQKFHAAATAYAGTKIDTVALAKQLKGEKEGDAEATAAQVSGVTRATVSLSPSWSTSVPKVTSHIHIAIKVSNPSG